MRVLRPASGIFAFYDGRVDGYRFAQGANWVDDGALSLGIASYAVVAGDEALVYDTHVSVEHARYVREVLEEEGVNRFTVVLSHWHLDHVAGTAAFHDCDVIASERTNELLTRLRPAIEAVGLSCCGQSSWQDWCEWQAWQPPVAATACRRSPVAPSRTSFTSVHARLSAAGPR